MSTQRNLANLTENWHLPRTSSKYDDTVNYAVKGQSEIKRLTGNNSKM